MKEFLASNQFQCKIWIEIGDLDPKKEMSFLEGEARIAWTMEK
jgi:hypothetical protein